MVADLGFEPDSEARLWVGVSYSHYVKILNSVGGVEGRKTGSSPPYDSGVTSAFKEQTNEAPKGLHLNEVVTGGW